MTNLVDTSPLAGFLRGLQNQRWTAAGAISELVDNSFGSGRGQASNVWVTWDANKRILTVLDDGRGMDSLSRLFRLGDTVGRSIGDIGEYGSGGTMALLWLADRLTIWTLRGGKFASDGVVWRKHITSGLFPQIDDDWYQASEENTPTELLELGHGTLIRLALPPKRHITVGTVQNELARTYGPALRQNKRLIWRTIRGPKVEERQLSDLIELPTPSYITVDFELDDQVLVAHGEVGVIPGLTLSQSGVAICFGPRLLRLTRDCFRSPDGSESFAGIGLTGYLDLADGWQPFLSTTKSSVDDDRAWARLMAGLFKFLRPMLQELERDRRQVLFDDLALELKDIFNGRVLVSVDEGGTLQRDPEGQERVGKRREGPATDSEPSDPASRFDNAAVKLDLVDATDDELDGLLCRVDVTGNLLEGFINIEHSFVIAALGDSPPNRRALQKMVVDAIAARVVSEHPHLLSKMFPAGVLRRFERLGETSLQHGYLVRLLIDRIREDDAA